LPDVLHEEELDVEHSQRPYHISYQLARELRAR
jgi:hypothetical protein